MRRPPMGILCAAALGALSITPPAASASSPTAPPARCAALQVTSYQPNGTRTLATGPFPSAPEDVLPQDSWRAVASGRGVWHDPSTWVNGAGGFGVPDAGDVVWIPAGVTVELSARAPEQVPTSPAFGATRFWPGYRLVRIDGELRFASEIDTELSADTVFVSPTGTLRAGAAQQPVSTSAICRLTILPEVDTSAGSPTPAPIDPAWDPGERSRGLIAMGEVHLFGDPRQHVVTVPTDVRPRAGLATPLIQVQPEWNWQTGDEVALAGTAFTRGATDSDPLMDERFRIELAGTTAIAPPGTLTKKHIRATNPSTGMPFPLHLVHLERNVIIGSGWPQLFPGEPMPLAARGHFMFSDGAAGGTRFVHLEHVRFDELGRTDKSIPLDDIEVEIEMFDTHRTYAVHAAPGLASSSHATPIRNRRGRYAVHFHVNGNVLPLPARKRVVGCVVTGTPGWGFVNHSSHVDFIDCVCHDFAGSAFVTESGDEVGRFEGCVAMHGTGIYHETPGSG
ncbi:MAG: G8 domain-containing protein, partial [Planctomycetota bacterium]